MEVLAIDKRTSGEYACVILDGEEVRRVKMEICWLCSHERPLSHVVLVKPWGRRWDLPICLACAGLIQRAYARKVNDDRSEWPSAERGTSASDA